MAQHLDVLLPAERYTRADFIALRAWLNKLPLARIAAFYYSADDLEALGCASPAGVQRRLETLRDTLIARASDRNPHAAEGLRTARRVHTWSPAAIDFISRAAEADFSRPRPSDAVSAWFRGRVAAVLKGEGLHTLGELLATIGRRGDGWWKPIPRLGAGKAQAIVRWLQAHPDSLGAFTVNPAVPPPLGPVVVLSPDAPRMVPLERVALSRDLDGSQGVNRHPNFPLISARHDLAAIEAYLYKYREQEKTARAYRKELERFLLWCIYARQKPLSSVLTDDCEAYKDFLQAPPPDWVGPKTVRRSADWRPFAGIPSPGSQKYAVQAIRSFFAWLVNVRYLAGNPWLTVGDPAVAQALLPLQIDKALPAALWQQLVDEGGLLARQAARSDEELRVAYSLRGAAATISMAAQFRLVRAALLLLGDGGLRREEAALATRARLKPVAGTPDLWELDVLGKRNKWRTVFLPSRAIAAIEAHWRDRGLDFSFALADLPLLSPLVALPTASAQRKHVTGDGARREAGFSPDGLYQVIKTALVRIADDDTVALAAEERQRLRDAGPHVFRHTFGTQAVAGEVPLDVLQRVLGHASLQTTTIYVQAEKKRSIQELGKFFRKKD